MFTHYKNLNGNSGVLAYQPGADYIIVRFKSAWGHRDYLYTYRSAGMQAIEQMRMYADLGYGLNSYISRHVNYTYESR